MKHLLSTVIVLGTILSPGFAHAENALIPSPVDRSISSPIPAASARFIPGESHTAAIRAWKRSLIPVAISQSLDISSSYGMRELNPMLAGPDGRFGAKAATIKLEMRERNGRWRVSTRR